MSVKICVFDCEDKQVGLLLTGEESKQNYVLIKDFNTFLYDHKLHRGRKNLCRYCLKAFKTPEKLKFQIKDCFKIKSKQRIKIQKKGEYVRLKKYERKIRSPFMI